MDQIDFLQTVVTSADSGKLLICSRNHETPWIEEYYDWPDQVSLVAIRIQKLKDKHDVYFSPHLFSTEASTKSGVIVSRTIQADLDAATDYPFEPTVLVQTSPNRYQGYWVLKENYEVEPVELERLSKRLTYNIKNADHTGWPLGKRLRIPGTLNFKYNNGPHEVSVVTHSGKLYTPEDFELLPAVQANLLALQDNDFIDTVDNINLGGPLELLQALKDKIPHGVYYDYINKVTAEDRSGALWSMMCTLLESGLTREQVFWLAKYSPNNKFAAELRYHANRELAKAVQEAEKKVKIKQVSIVATIDIVRNMATPNIPGGALMKRRQIYFAVKLAMDATGKFVRVIAGLPYFIPKDTGRPIALTPGSEHLRALLHLRYGINSADPEYKYIHDGVIDEGVTLDKEIQESTFSYFDSKSLYVHTGKKDVVRVSADKFELVENASDDILFPWHDIFEPFQFDPNNQYDGDWADAIFGDLHNTTNMSSASAKALLKSWLIFTLFRSLIATRPILAFFGPPGCLAYDTPIKVKRGGMIREYTIRDIYAKFNNRYTIDWDSSIPTMVQSVKDGVVQYRNIANVVASGLKKVYLIEIEGQQAFKATADHKFLTPTGYKSLSKLRKGDLVVVREYEEPLGRQSWGQSKKRIMARYHPNATFETTEHGKYSYRRIPYSHAVVEADHNNLDIKEFCYIIHHDEERAKTLHYLDKSAEVHHKDENHSNDSLDNLEVTTYSGHARGHGDDNKFHFGYFETTTARVVGILPCKEVQTYDIMMEDADAPNFLVNDVVVHNSSKSTIPHRIYALFYSRRLAVSGVSGAADFDMSSSKLPVLCVDNLDSYVSWIVDKLAQAIGNIDILKRKLFTDVDTIRHRRQAMIIVTAHNPKFTREDVTSRLLLITLNEIEKNRLLDESPFIDHIVANRPRLWASILQDVQKVLQTPKPSTSTVKWRIQDFASIGEWIAVALGHQNEFNDGLRALLTTQSDTIIQQEELLSQALRTISPESLLTSLELWNELLIRVGANQSSFVHTYKNPIRLAQKLITMRPALRSIVEIEQVQDEVSHQKKWRITPISANGLVKESDD